MRKPAEVGGGSSSSNSWGSGLCAKSCRLLQKLASSTSTTKKKKSSGYVKGRNVISSSTTFGEDEDDLIIKLHALLGNRWSLIAGRLPGRTDNEVKNYWNSHLRKKLQHKGNDHPGSHRSLSHQTVIPTNFTAVKAGRPASYNDQVSDAVSFSADYVTSTSPPMAMPAEHHLNLELTLTINPSPSSLISSTTYRFTETDQNVDHQFKLGNKDHHHDQFMKNETLLLFR